MLLALLGFRRAPVRRHSSAIEIGRSRPSTRLPARRFRMGAASALASATCAVAGLALLPSSAAGATLYTGFLAQPTDQIAVPGMEAGAEITPEGNLYTGWAEYALRYGRRLLRWDQPTRTAPDPSLPKLASTSWDGLVEYTVYVFAVPVDGRPVAYESVEVRNRSSHLQRGAVAMLLSYARGAAVAGPRGAPTTAYRYERPAVSASPGLYSQPGIAWSPAFRYEARERDLDRSGALLARGPARSSARLPAPPGNGPGSEHVGRSFAFELRGGGRLRLTWQIPLDPPAASGAVDGALDRVSVTGAERLLRAIWRRELAGSMTVRVPEAKVDAAFEAAIVEMLESRFLTAQGWEPASNKLQYQAVWLRDATLETVALDLAGLHRQAAQNLSFLDTLQQPDGLFISRAGQYDGVGQAIWALARHAALIRSPASAAAQIPRVTAAVDWLQAASAGDPLGLLPPSNPGDDELAYGHIAGDDIWAAVGLSSAAELATMAGEPTLASTWEGAALRFSNALRSDIATAVSRRGYVPPVLDSAEGQDWGNYDVAYPREILPAGSPAVEATVRWAKSHMREGLLTYDDGRSLHDYLGFSLLETELEAGDPKAAVEGLYAELTHTTATNNGWEWDVPPFGKRASNVNLSPHGTFAADYVTLLRNLLVREAPDGSLDLLGGASPTWLAPGDRILARDMPTPAGTISFVLRSSAHAETLRWKSDLAPGTAVRWILPWWAGTVRVGGRRSAARVISLAGPSGTVTAQLSGRPPSSLSYRSARASLDASYVARGKKAPLVPSGHHAP